MPVVEAAWLAGAVGGAQVSLLADARTPATAECFERDEALLVAQAGQLSSRGFARVLAYWTQRADPDGADASAEAQHAARRLHLSQTYGGSWVLDGLLHPINGSIVSRALGRIESELFAAEWAEAKRVGHGVCAEALARTPAQRRADALVEMARRAMAVKPGARLPEPLFTVLVGYESFAGRICQLADGTVVARGALGAGWTRPGCSGWSSTAPTGWPTWACAGASSPAPPAGPWRCAIASATASSARWPPTTARSTT